MSVERQVTLKLVHGSDSHYASIEASRRVKVASIIECNFGSDTADWCVYLPGPDGYRYPGFPHESFSTAEEAAETFFKFMELP